MKFFKKIQQKLSTFPYFGQPNDDVGRLFTEICDLSYNMAQYGEKDKSIILALWAKEYALYSKVVVENEDPEALDHPIYWEPQYVEI